MDVDLIVKYRPQFLREFWNQGGTVEIVRMCLRALCLPKSLLVVGEYGSGKTTLARVIGRALSCEDSSDPEPCGKCEGCLNPGLRMMSRIGAVLEIHGNRFDLNVLRHFANEECYYPPPEAYNAHLVILDEAHRIKPSDQEAMLDLIEDTPRTHFVFCTTKNDMIDEGIRKRSRTLQMGAPTAREALEALHRIATCEAIEIADGVLTKIVEQNNRNPRGCLKDLQYYKGLGSLPKSS